MQEIELVRSRNSDSERACGQGFLDMETVILQQELTAKMQQRHAAILRDYALLSQKIEDEWGSLSTLTHKEKEGGCSASQHGVVRFSDEDSPSACTGGSQSANRCVANSSMMLRASFLPSVVSCTSSLCDMVLRVCSLRVVMLCAS